MSGQDRPELDLKQCATCGGWIPASATMCAQCGSSHVDRPPERTAQVHRGPVRPGLPPVTKGLLVANIVYYLFSLYLQHRVESGGNVLGLVMGGPSGFAANAAGYYRHDLVADGQWWRVLSATFLHAGLLHIGMNMYALIQLGPMVERTLGAARTLAIYLVSAIGSTLAISIWFVHIAHEPPPPMLGASGAICGLVGVLITFLRRRGNQLGRLMARQLTMNALFLLAIGLMVRFISNTGHVGGFIPGAILGLFVGDRFRDRLDPTGGRIWTAAAVLLTLVTAVALVAAAHHGLNALGGS